jgi:hypothetical protein
MAFNLSVLCINLDDCLNLWCGHVKILSFHENCNSTEPQAGQCYHFIRSLDALEL